MTYKVRTVYDVKLTRPIDYHGARLLPLQSHEMSGRVLNAIVEKEGADVVDAAEPR